MAERRMFAKTIIDSDAFLEMPATAQMLYFHLAMRADDDGFINNPKRIMREVHKQMEHSGIGTKSQQALKLQLEQMKTERRTLSREQREAEKERQFEIRQQKKKEKHRGR